MNKLNSLQEKILLQLADSSIGEMMGNIVKESSVPYRELMAYYKCAMLEVATKFDVLNEELSLQYDRNPIESIKTRLKSPESIMGKLKRKGILPSVEDIENNLFDIAGIRVICSFPNDIYMLANALEKQDDITVIEKKDYITHPKPNGYRSYHMIIETPIFLYERKKYMKVEVQFRTISMDWWASLEHKIRYKKDVEITDEISNELLMCAEISAGLDQRMQEIQDKVNHIATSNKKKLT